MDLLALCAAFEGWPARLRPALWEDAPSATCRKRPAQIRAHTGRGRARDGYHIYLVAAVVADAGAPAFSKRGHKGPRSPSATRHQEGAHWGLSETLFKRETRRNLIGPRNAWEDNGVACPLGIQNTCAGRGVL